MSADNWTICPKCTENELHIIEQKKIALENAYGKVSAKAYLLLVEELTKAEEKLNNEDDNQYTLREDYEMGIRNGNFYVSYRGSCGICGFSFEHKHEENIKL